MRPTRDQLPSRARGEQQHTTQLNPSGGTKHRVTMSRWRGRSVTEPADVRAAVLGLRSSPGSGPDVFWRATDRDTISKVRGPYDSNRLRVAPSGCSCPTRYPVAACDIREGFLQRVVSSFTLFKMD